MLILKGREIAESGRQHIEENDKLEVGNLIKEYNQSPQDAQVRFDIGGEGRMLAEPIVKKRGKVLERDVQMGRLAVLVM